MNVAKSLTEALHEKRKAQTWMAAQMGVSDAYISAICLGQKMPSVQKLAHMAQILGYKTSAFIKLGE